MSVVIFFSVSQLFLPVDYLNEHSSGNRWNGLFLSTRQKEKKMLLFFELQMQ